MMYFAESIGTVTELAGILTIFGGMLVGFYQIAKLMLNQSVKEREQDRGERQELTRAIQGLDESRAAMAEATKELVRETHEGNKQAAERNGHLAELVMESGKQTKALADGAVKTILEGVRNINEQHVEHVHVEHETISNKEGGK